MLALGALTCLGVLAWEVFLYAYVLGGDEPLPSALLRSAVWDAAVLLPVILSSLVGSLWAGRLLGFEPKKMAGLLGSTALVGLFFLALMTPAVILRDLAFPGFLGRPADIALNASVGNLAPALSNSRFLCALSPVQSALDPAQRAWFEPVLEGLRTVLVLQVGLLPLVLFGMAALFRGRVLPASVKHPDRLARVAVVGVGLMASCGLPHDSDKTAEVDLAIAPLTNPCTSGGTVRSYDVSAINVNITLNRFGDHDPSGFMYVLDSNISALRVQETAALPDRVSIGLREDLIQPLVIRANLGECLQINFTNRLASGDSSWHINGLPFTVTNQGSKVGLNSSGFVSAGGGTATYQIPIPIDASAERAYYFHEHGASRQRVAHGLFGALIVEPAGAQYLDPQTGAALTGSNWEAIIDMPGGGPDFREYVLIYHEVGDEAFVGILNANDVPLPQIEPVTAIYRPGARGINYRSEPFRNRMALNQDKSQGYGSYMFGDPATPIPRSYLGEPTKTRLLHAGSELFHVHHLHGGGDRWRRNPKIEASDFATGLQKLPVQNALSTRLDSQSIGPGVGFTLEHECGAGGCQQSAGDFLFHCHIGHHYIAGMWSFWRVFDTLQADLATLPDRAAAPAAVNSRGLIGLVIEGKTLVTGTPGPGQRSLQDWIEAQLPPQGARLNAQDATVWDWDRVDDPVLGPLYKGEPEDTAVWADFQSPTPGVRPEIKFNPNNGRYAWPLLRPHLGKRPPFSANGHSGAPWLGENGSAERPDGLCPNNAVLPNPDRQTRQYPITAIPISIPVNATTNDVNGRLYVLNEDKAGVIAGTKPAQPLAIRSNVGDCVHVIFTNEIPVDTIGEQPKVNMHTHFVQFDPQASDGVISGLSYEQAVRPYPTVENRTLVNPVSAGATSIDTTNVTDLRTGIWLGVGLGEGMCASGSASVPCTEIRRITGISGTTITLDQPLALSHAAGQAVGVEFVQYNWYSDVDSGAIFWHDHVNFHSWGHGLIGSHIIEPAGSTYHDPATGAEVRSGPIVDIHAPATATIGAGQIGSFREFMVWTSNDTTVFSAAAGGANGLINMRSAPFSTRTAVGADPAWTFSSVRWGDPSTPIPRAYVGDPVVFRNIAVEKFIGGLRVSGHRFRLERFAANAALSDAAPVGVSERWDLVLDGGAGGPGGKPGDYLYYSTLGQELVGGAWGIFRVHDKLQGDLQALPDQPEPPTGDDGFPQLTFTGAAPTAASSAGTACPVGAPVKSYNVTIAPTSIQYSATKTDANGVIYLLSGGTVPNPATEPLVLRVNQGDCLEITLTNNLTTRAGVNIGKLLFDPQGSYGAAIGYNPDSSVAASGTKLYRFYADQELGTNVLFNLANPTQGRRGAYGAVVVEPSGATYRDPTSGAAITTGLQADILAPSGNFREFVALFADNDPQLGQDRMPYPIAAVDFTGLSYSAPRLVDRGSATNPTSVFDTSLWGDPRHVVKADVGDPLTFRVAQPWGEQAHVFFVEGHRWAMENALPGSEQIGMTYLVPFYSLDAQLTVGAGGDISAPGDYLFGDHRQPYIEAGLWGLVRVSPAGTGGILPLP